MLKADWKAHELHFKFPAGTSRGVLHSKPSFFLTVWNEEQPHIKGVGECSLIPGLSPETTEKLPEGMPSVAEKIDELCRNINDLPLWQGSALEHYPALRFALEMALLCLKNKGSKQLFPSPFTIGTKGIPVNGLIWMGTAQEMKQRIRAKLDDGFACLKMKIGAIGWQDELDLLKTIRREYTSHDLVLRVDANGAFQPNEAAEVLKELAELDIHSIEQPIAAGRYEAMSELCEETPVPIALDEELIGLINLETRVNVIETIKPQYIILKPSLLGGFASSQHWIDLAEKRNIGWWVTSALEANIGLNAIAQWTATLGSDLHQGLGTGALFKNNFKCPLEVEGGHLFYRPEKVWELDGILE